MSRHPAARQNGNATFTDLLLFKAFGTQDRLIVMDVFRHLGRGRLTPFAGGVLANRAFEREFWRTAPYTEADLQRQYDDADDLYGADGVKMQHDIQARTLLAATKVPASTAYPARRGDEG